MGSVAKSDQRRLTTTADDEEAMDGTKTRLDRPWREVQGREKPYLLSNENQTLLTRNQSPHTSL